jgi:hypothetical protein
LRRPPRVIDEAPTVAVKPATSTPAHFQTNVARCHSRNPTRVASSSAPFESSGVVYEPVTHLA